jgi:nitric oxide reductase subunit B
VTELIQVREIASASRHYHCIITENIMSSSRKLWAGLAILLTVSFAVLLWVGSEIHRVMPPIPAAVVSTTGETLYTRADIEKGRQVWQSIGGHQLGSIWGHGSYVAPDWTADWLHREARAWLDIDAQRETSHSYADLGPDAQAAFAARLRPRIRANTYELETDTWWAPACSASLSIRLCRSTTCRA